MTRSAVAAPTILRPRRKGAVLPGEPAVSTAGMALDLLRSHVWDLDVGSVLAEPALSVELGASRNSVRAGLRALSTEGVVERRTRVGTTVRVPMAPAVLDVAAPRADGELLESTVRRVVAPRRIQVLLQLDDDAVVTRSVSVRRHADALAVHVVYEVVPRLACEPVSARVRSTHVRCDAESAGLLGVAEGTPAIWTEEVSYDDAGQPVGVAFDRIVRTPMIDGSRSVI